MSSGIPQPAECCNPCEATETVNIPGPTGATGADGEDGQNGVSAFTITTEDFTMPAVSANVTVAVANSSWMTATQPVYVNNVGTFSVQAVPTNTSVTLQNLGYSHNVAPTTLISALRLVSPSGLKGLDGVAVGVTFNSISPTTTKGDLIADNGINSPAASNVSLGVGTNGQVLTADSTQATGLLWDTLYLDGSGSLTFGLIAGAGGISDQTIAVVGAAVNDPVSVGPPVGVDAGLVPHAFVSAVGVVTIRLTNTTAGNITPAAAQTWNCRVHK